jgi:hypothetical protein
MEKKWYCSVCRKFIEFEEVVYDEFGNPEHYECNELVLMAPIPIQSVCGESEPPKHIWRCITIRDGQPHIWWAYTPIYGGSEYILNEKKGDE